MKCKEGGFDCIHLDEVRKVTVKILKDFFLAVIVDPLKNARLTYQMANSSNKARIGLCAGCMRREPTLTPESSNHVMPHALRA